MRVHIGYDDMGIKKHRRSISEVVDMSFLLQAFFLQACKMTRKIERRQEGVRGAKQHKNKRLVNACMYLRKKFDKKKKHRRFHCLKGKASLEALLMGKHWISLFSDVWYVSFGWDLPPSQPT